VTTTVDTLLLNSTKSTKLLEPVIIVTNITILILIICDSSERYSVVKTKKEVKSKFVWVTEVAEVYLYGIANLSQQQPLAHPVEGDLECEMHVYCLITQSFWAGTVQHMLQETDSGGSEPADVPPVQVICWAAVPRQPWAGMQFWPNKHIVKELYATTNSEGVTPLIAKLCWAFWFILVPLLEPISLKLILLFKFVLVHHCCQ